MRNLRRFFLLLLSSCPGEALWLYSFVYLLFFFSSLLYLQHSLYKDTYTYRHHINKKLTPPCTNLHNKHKYEYIPTICRIYKYKTPLHHKYQYCYEHNPRTKIYSLHHTFRTHKYKQTHASM